MVPETLKALTLLRLFRFAKFKHVSWSTFVVVVDRRSLFFDGVGWLQFSEAPSFYRGPTWSNIMSNIVEPHQVDLSHMKIISGVDQRQWPWRLLFIWRLAEAMVELESILESRGLIRAKHISTILQCVIFILIVNHVLACVTCYVGRREQQSHRTNWMDENQVTENSWLFQYMQLGEQKLVAYWFHQLVHQFHRFSEHDQQISTDFNR